MMKNLRINWNVNMFAVMSSVKKLDALRVMMKDIMKVLTLRSKS